jgi:hypothetical protein
MQYEQIAKDFGYEIITVLKNNHYNWADNNSKEIEKEINDSKNDIIKKLKGVKIR